MQIWTKISDQLPREYEKVLLYDGEGIYWVGFYQLCSTMDNKKVYVWWAANPNEISQGHQPFLTNDPKFWCRFK